MKPFSPWKVQPWLLACLLALQVGRPGAYAETAHRLLLPEPQEVHYGDGTLPLARLEIRLTSKPDPEDQFAAQLLADQLSRLVGVNLRITTGGHGPAIRLIRDLPGQPMDTPNSGANSSESYSIQVSRSGAEIHATASAGLFYGVQTLLQLIEGRGSEAGLPLVTIRDWPTMARRGFMMDLSHGQILKVEEIERQLDLLARYKANQYFFYSEASIEWKGYELVNPDGRYTRAQVQQVIDYARQRHIEVVPCLELYGHLHDLFRVERFADLGLPRYGGEFDPRNPRVLAIIDDILDQAARLFPSPWCHVGFDEPWALGKIGVTPGQDPYRAFLDVLRHAANRAQKNGKQLLFWADIHSGSDTLSNHPELIDALPEGAIAVPWVYDAKADYTDYVQPLAKTNKPFVVAPAVWNWNEVFPDYHHSFVNINGLVATGRKHQALGMLNTGWADSGQTLYRLSWPGLAFGAAAAWQSGPVNTNQFFRAYASQVYPASVAEDIAVALEELSGVEEAFRRILQRSTQNGFWDDPLEPRRLARLEQRQTECREARLLAESAMERLLRAQSLAPSDPTIPTLLLAARSFDYLGMKCLYAVEWNGYFRELRANPTPKLIDFYLGMQMNAMDHGMMADLVDTVTNLRDRYREAWLMESTSYRLGSALARWDAECDLWRSTWSRVESFLRHRPKADEFPSIEILRPPR